MKLIIENLVKNFEKKEVLKGASFTFEQGKIYGLIGRNGAGKTTLFNCINEDIAYENGLIYISSGDEKRKLESTDVGYVLSTPVVPEFLTAREFVKFFLDINKDRIVEPKTIDEYLSSVRIEEEDRNKLLKDFSHGMKNKMQMLTSFIANPAILLLDEPLTSFDVVVAEEMKQILIDIKHDHIIIFSTHIMELALDLCDEVVILNNGVLSEIARDNLVDDEYKSKIISALKDADND